MQTSAAFRLDGFQIIDVRDPAEMDERSLVSRRLSARDAPHTYTLRDRTTLRSAERGALLSRHANSEAGDVQLSHVAERFGTEIGMLEPGIPAYCFGWIRSGRHSTAAADGTVEAGAGQGFIVRATAGTRAVTADGTVRTNLWIAAPRFESALSACLGERLRAPLAFGAAPDWPSMSGGALHRLVLYAAEDLPNRGGLASNVLALEAFVDLFVHTALRVLPHNYSERLERQPDGAAPSSVRRAESFFRERATEAVRMEDVAAVAGCSVRSLQRAFRVFRDTTPHGALARTRLELARTELARGEASVASVARRYGFSNVGRFAAAYRSRFGEGPSDARRSAGLHP